MDRSQDQYERQLIASRAWKRANAERHAELARAYRARNREKTKAQNSLNYAIRKGDIVRGNCEECGTSEKVHAHHDDYSKPLQVKWLCFMCHKLAHPVDDEDKRVKFEGAKRADVSGIKNPCSRLTEEQVKQIRESYKSGVSQQKIADSLSVSQATISQIIRGLRYQSVL